MSTSPTAWQWDPNRRAYYVWVAEEGAWVYQNGTRLYPPSSNVPPSTPDSSAPRGSRDLERRVSTGAYSIPETQTSPSAASGTSSGIDYTHTQLGDQLSALHLGGRNADGTELRRACATLPQSRCRNSSNVLSSSAPASYSRPTYVSPTQHAESSRQAYPQDVIAPSQLQRYQAGSYLYAKIPSTPGEVERLDPRYKVRRPGNAFFKIGKVFRVLWAEPAGNPNASVSEVYCQTQFQGERLIAKIRWFVVVLPGQDNSCQCLPINTYNNQGVAKHGVIKCNHAIIHNHNKRPVMSEGEKPGPGERGMISPIRVRARTQSDRLHAMSRINFARAYTVEHNVKVYEFGDVVKDDLHDLYNQWTTVVNRERDNAWNRHISDIVEEPSEGTEEAEEEDVEEGDDSEDPVE